MKNRLLRLIFTLLSASAIQAQSVINVTDISGWPDSVAIGSSSSFSVSVTYVSGIQQNFIAENLRIKYLTDKMVENDIEAENFAPPEDVFFTLGNSFDIFVQDFTFDSTNFRQGGNIVVIWPSYGGGTTSDSLIASIDGILPDSVNGVEKLLGVDLRTVWLNDRINWPALEKIDISEGVVLNSTGKLIHVINKEIAISPKQIEPGIHYFMFRSSNGKIVVFKEFIK